MLRTARRWLVRGVYFDSIENLEGAVQWFECSRRVCQDSQTGLLFPANIVHTNIHRVRICRALDAFAASACAECWSDTLENPDPSHATMSDSVGWPLGSLDQSLPMLALSIVLVVICLILHFFPACLGFERKERTLGPQAGGNSIDDILMSTPRVSGSSLRWSYPPRVSQKNAH